MAKFTSYDATFTKRASEEVLISLDLTDWMDSGEGAASTPTATAYDRSDGTDVSSTYLDSGNDTLDSTDLFYLWLEGGTDGDDVEIEVEWTTDAVPAQVLAAVVLLRVRDLADTGAVTHRTTERDIKLILDTTLTETQLTPYLNTASLIVSTYLSGESMSAGLLREIEMYLAAHFAVFSRDRQAIEEIIGDAEIKYPRESLGKGLDATSYGQTAKMLDSSGILAGIGSTTTATLEAVDLW